jgi:GAF domain-containing protein
MPSDDEMVVSLRNAARELMAKRSIRDLDETLTQIVEAAVQTVPGVNAGGISITQDGQVRSRNPTSGTVAKLDQLQTELNEGPCITALEQPPEDGVVVAHDLAGGDEKRWPRFAAQAVEAGFQAIMSTHLSASRHLRAALNLYATEPQVFDAEARHIAGLFGLQAAILLYGSETAEQLRHAVDTRDVIGQAKGILMERFTIDDDEAFQMLVRSSQDTNVKVVNVAEFLRSEARRRREIKHSPPGDA